MPFDARRSDLSRLSGCADKPIAGSTMDEITATAVKEGGMIRLNQP